MKKIAIAAAAVIFVLPVSAFAVKNDERPVLPVGGISAEFIKMETSSGIPDISLFENNVCDEGGAENVTPADFYSYGGDYAYQYYKSSGNEAKVFLYEQILESCKTISTTKENYADIYTVYDYGMVIDGALSINLTKMQRDYPEQVIILDEEKYKLTANDVAEVYFMFRNDHPEYYWLLDSCAAQDNKLLMLLNEDYNDYEKRFEVDELISENINACLSSVKPSEPQSDQQTVKLVYDYIAGLVEYGFDETGQPLDTAYAHSITGVFDGDPETDVVCEGYAKAFQLILNALDIDNIYVTGNAYNGVEWGGHAWNMVRMDDGQYYNFDITWDDSGNTVTYRYFAAGNWFNGDHVPGSPEETSVDFLYELPQAPNKDYEIEDPYLANMECEAAATENGTYTFEVEFDDHVENSIAVAACYDSQGRLIEIKMVEVNGTHAEINGVEVGTDAADVTVMAWLDGSNTPIAPCVEFNVASSEEDQ